MRKSSMYFDKISEEFSIGSVRVANRLALAPMAGITDQPFRMLCKRMGCGLLTSEMVSAKGLLYNNERTFELLEYCEFEQPFAVQLFGSEPEIIAEAAVLLQQRGVDIIDINMGCPVSKIVNAGEGSALLKTPGLVEKIVTAATKAVKVPLTIKIRVGWDEDSVNCCEIARIAEASGAAAIAVHARTRAQFYGGTADWSAIAAVKRSVRIPVFGNGDIFTAQSALDMMNRTDCDAIMVGRGAMGNPWLFREILFLAETGEQLLPPGISERIAMIDEHLTALKALKGEARAVKEMRSHAAWYTKGLRNAAAMRRRFNNACTSADFMNVFLTTSNVGME